MIAINTNIVIRYLTNDDLAQAERARQLVEAENVFVAKTVLLEAEWVLRSVYKFPRMRIAEELAASLPCQPLSSRLRTRQL